MQSKVYFRQFFKQNSWTWILLPCILSTNRHHEWFSVWTGVGVVSLSDLTIKGMGSVLKILILREFLISRLCRFISYCDNRNGELRSFVVIDRWCTICMKWNNCQIFIICGNCFLLIRADKFRYICRTEC